MNNMPAEKNLKTKKTNEIVVYLYRFFNYLVILLVIVILILGYSLVLKPKYDKINTSLSLKLEKYKTAKTDREEYLKKLEVYQNSFKKIDQANQIKVNTMIDEDILPESIYSEISALVASKNIILNSISIKEQIEKSSKSSDKSETKIEFGSDVAVLDFTINLMGVNYEALKDLLHTLETSMRMYNVTRVSFSPKDNRAILQIQKYYLKK